MIFNFKKKHTKHCHKNCCHANNIANNINSAKSKLTLSDAPENKKVQILANSDLKTMEMGIYPGAIITLLQNNPSNPSIIVKVHDQKFVVPKTIAKQIFIKVPR